MSLVGLFALPTAIAAAEVCVPQAEVVPADDGWRWTTTGWENVRDWSQPPRTMAIGPAAFLGPTSAGAMRFDTHPATWILVQLGLVVLAFRLLPPRVEIADEGEL